jgi:hypothetical protein
VWSEEKRAEGLEYMHPKLSSHSVRIVGNSSATRLGKGCPSSSQKGPWLFETTNTTSQTR